MLLEQHIADISIRVSSLIRWRDMRFFQPFERRKPLVVLDRRLKEIYHILMLTVLRAVARYVECRETCSVLAELVAPETGVILVLRDPVVVHVFE